MKSAKKMSSSKEIESTKGIITDDCAVYTFQVMDQFLEKNPDRKNIGIPTTQAIYMERD